MALLPTAGVSQHIWRKQGIVRVTVKLGFFHDPGSGRWMGLLWCRSCLQEWTIWDLGGQGRYRVLWERYVRAGARECACLGKGRSSA